MQADRFRLRKDWLRMHSRDIPSAELLASWQTRAEASAELRRKRAESLPQLHFDPELPISAHREEIVDLIRTRQTIVVCGETGSGKSTQLPKLCLEAGLGVGAMIGHTQPRRLAARAVSSRLAEELSSRVGERVGFKIRFTDATKPETLVKLMTDGVLLAETQSDRFLDQYDALIIDEAHERSLNIDFLLGFLRQLSGRRPDLKLIITSATIDPQRFAEHFADEQGPAPIVEVSGRTYPVEMRYRATESSDDSFVSDELLVAIADASDELIAEGPGDILVFLPTERDIRETAKHLRGHFTRTGGSVDILPLYARLSQAEQNKIFAPHGGRRIVLSTNVAESSLTVPGIRYVIDTGLVRIARYAPRSKVQRLPIEGVSQASANQRAGRCGRLGPGICIRLFSSDDYATRSQYTTPEIRRSDLASVLLQSKTLRLGSLAEFPLLDPPSAESLRDAERTLRELGAIDHSNELTAIGRQLGRLPCDPRVGRMLLEAHERNCVAEVIIIAAALETQDVRQRPAGQRPQADEAHAQFADPHSDFLSYLRMWDFYDRLRNDLGRARLQKALTQKFLSPQGFREWADIVRQLKELLATVGIKTGSRKTQLPPINREQLQELADQRHQRGKANRPNHRADSEPAEKLKRPDGYAEIHQSLLSGLLSGIAQRGDTHEYKAAGGLSISLWPGSGLFSRKPKWIMAAEIVETSKRYGRTVAEVDVEWIEKAAEGLLKHSYSDPHWSSKTGAGMVYRRSTLYGLAIVTGQRVSLASVDSDAARDMLIEHGLVEGDWNCQEAFYRHNQEMLADMHELVQRTRSREYILDRYHLAAFYSARVPNEVIDLASLRSWTRKHAGQPAEKALWMQPHDLLDQKEQPIALEEAFPNTIQVGATEFPLAYHFEPGHDVDGVTITVPQAALRQVSDEALGWLVPGLLEEKILHLIRALPKSLRTNFVPAPDVAGKLAQQLAQVAHDQPFSQALCQAMSAHAGEKILPSHFEWDKIPEHLKFVVRVVDDEGKLVKSGRDVVELQNELAPPDTTSGATNCGQSSDWSNRVVTPLDFDELPTQVAIRRGGLVVAAFPALVALDDQVEMRLADTAAEADRLSRHGWTLLLAIKHHRLLRSQVSHLPEFSPCCVKLGHLLPSRDLTSQLQDLIVQIALLEDQPLIRTREEFEARNARAAGQISVATQEVAIWLPKFAEAVHQVRLLTEKPPEMWREVFESIRQQVQSLVRPGFLTHTPWKWLSEYPRYLHAIRLRIDKLKSGGLPKDRKLAEPIQAAWTVYQRHSASSNRNTPEAAERLEELRWMIEELRVSIFAQQLGTKISVSPKRVQSLADELG